MKPGLIYAPMDMFSARVCEALPATRALLDVLRSEFDVQLLESPWLRGAPPPFDWDIFRDELRSMLGPSTHVVGDGEGVIPALLALDRMPATGGCFVAVGLNVTSATLRALGATVWADYLQEHHRVESEQGRMEAQTARLWMQGAPEGEIRKLAGLLDRDIDWLYLRSEGSRYAALNLLSNPPLIEVPTLYLESDAQPFQYRSMRRVFLRFAPHSEARSLQRSWPSRMHDAESGREVGQEIIRFVGDTTGR
jgi:hypothetical protein